MRKKNDFLVKASDLLIINLHQSRISPRLNKKGIKCRFYPSCSNYGILALGKYGFVKGWYLAIKRVFRCRPDNYDTCVDFP